MARSRHEIELELHAEQLRLSRARIPSVRMTVLARIDALLDELLENADRR